MLPELHTVGSNFRRIRDKVIHLPVVAHAELRAGVAISGAEPGPDLVAHGRSVSVTSGSPCGTTCPARVPGRRRPGQRTAWAQHFLTQKASSQIGQRVVRRKIRGSSFVRRTALKYAARSSIVAPFDVSVC